MYLNLCTLSAIIFQVYALHAALVNDPWPDGCSLLPRHVNHWWPIVEDDFMSHKISAISASLLEEVIRHDELQSVSLDCIMRCCLPVLGQAPPRSSKQQKKKSAFCGDQAFTRVPCAAQMLTSCLF